MPKTILIVDDESDITSRMSQIASREGYQPVAVADGIYALEYLKSNSVDLMITDGMMPRLCGDDLMRVITNMFPHYQQEFAQRYFESNLEAYAAFVERHKATPIIFMSKDTEAKELILKMGAVDFLQKNRRSSGLPPFNEAEFVTLLKKYLSG